MKEKDEREKRKERKGGQKIEGKKKMRKKTGTRR